MTRPIYAIPDIHGQKAMLDHGLGLIEADGGADAQIVFLGDYTDRGPDSRAVLDTLIEGKTEGRNWTVLKGNHDRMLHRFVTGGIVHDKAIKSGLSWLHKRLGGPMTLQSYGLDVPDDTADQPPISDIWHAARSSVPKTHIDFLGALPLHHQTGDLLFVHAGIVPGAALEWQIEDDLVWIREPFLSYAKPHPWLVVHGHTALDTAQHHGNRINLDGGAGYGRPLNTAVFEGRKCWRLTDRGRVPLRP